MNCRGEYLLLQAGLRAEIHQGLDRPQPHPTVEAVVTFLAAGGQKIARPAVEADAVDEILRLLRRLAIVFPAWIIGIGDGAIPIPTVNAVLTPDGALGDMDVLLLGEIAQVLGGQESADHTFGPVPAAHHFRHQLQPVMQIAVHLLAAVMHGREIGAGNESHLIPVFLLILHHLGADGAIVLPRILQGQPTEGPRHACARKGPFQMVPQGMHGLGRVQLRLVRPKIAVTGHLDLVDPYDADEGEKAVASECGRLRRIPAGRAVGHHQHAYWSEQAGRLGRLAKRVIHRHDGSRQDIPCSVCAFHEANPCRFPNEVFALLAGRFVALLWRRDGGGRRPPAAKTRVGKKGLDPS